MDQEVAGADDFEVFFKFFGHEPAGAVLQAVIALVVEDAVQEQVHLRPVRIDHEFVAFGKFLNGLQKIVFTETSLGRRSADRLGLSGRY
jgi:hypothetical protein